MAQTSVAARKINNLEDIHRVRDARVAGVRRDVFPGDTCGDARSSGFSGLGRRRGPSLRVRSKHPGAMRVGIIIHPDDPTGANEVKQAPMVASALGLTQRVLEVRALTDFDAAFATLMHENMQGLYVNSSPLFVSYRTELATLAARSHLPTIYGFRDFATAGGLMSYGASSPDLYRREAGLIDKILKGANRADMPIERPIVFELLINLRTARTLGLNITPSSLARADEVIE